MELTYQQYNETEQWVNNACHERANNAAFDDSSSVWQAAPDSVRELAEVSSRQAVLDSIHSGVNYYEKMHGKKPSGGVLNNAICSSLAALSPEYANKMTLGRAVFDNVTSLQSNAPMVSNRAQIVIQTAIGLSIPFAGYIPMTNDINNNGKKGNGLGGKIIIAGHAAEESVGEYLKNESLDGLNAGRTFMSSERILPAETTNNINYTFKFLHALGDADGSPVIPSHTEILVNGLSTGVAIQGDVNAATVPLVGFIKLEDGIEYRFTGGLNVEQGEGEITFTSPLPQGAEVHAVGLLNYEHKKLKDKRPVFMVTGQSFDFRAGFYSGLYKETPEAATQIKAEMALDPRTEGMFSMQSQEKIEKHFNGLRALYRVGKAYKHTANLNGSTRLNDRSMVSLWHDVLFKLNEADLAMVARTQSFGINYLYVGAKGAAHISSLPSEIFEPSYSPSVAGIYRLGRLFGKYDVYHAPNIVNETADSIEMLAIGSSEQAAMNPYVIGDILPPTFRELGVTHDLVSGAGFFSAGAARINPFHRAAKGAAIIAVTGLAL